MTQLDAVYNKFTSNINKLKAKGWKKIYHANLIQKKASGAILLSGKLGVRAQIITRDREGH